MDEISLSGNISRRQFLKLSALAFGACGAARFPPHLLGVTPPYIDQPQPFAFGRVTVPAIYIYQEPSFSSERVGMQYRDEVLSLLEEAVSESGPSYNPLWYRLVNGYAHCGRIQRIELHPPNSPLRYISDVGVYAEVTLPYVRSFRFTRSGWQPLYRLYYQSVHWIRGIEAGPDGEPWYRLKDMLLNVDYHAPAAALRPISFGDFSPTGWGVAPEDKRIVISIADQTLVAYEGDQVVLQTTISSGVHSENVPPGEIPTDTPTGNFHIQLKMASRHMGDGILTDEIGAYELLGVPWTMVFHETGAALHGTYWHNNFGTRMSHGCVNLRNADALWLFRWTDPKFLYNSWYKKGMGTLVQVV